MSAWTSDELEKIATADELEIAPVRRDGTLRNPVTVWVVRHGDDLYVRSVNGRGSSWFRGVQARHEGHVQAGGIIRDVRLVEIDNLNDEIDAAYRTKYHRYAAQHRRQHRQPRSASHHAQAYAAVEETPARAGERSSRV